MAAAPKLAEAVAMGIKNGAHPDNIAKTAYKRALWTQKTRLQRDFQAYGGDFLEQQPVCIGLYLYISISLYCSYLSQCRVVHWKALVFLSSSSFYRIYISYSSTSIAHSHTL